MKVSPSHIAHYSFYSLIFLVSLVACYSNKNSSEPKHSSQKSTQNSATKPESHDLDWMEGHKFAAGSDSSSCANCHTSKDCTDCHDGRIRPRNIHPNDWLSMHTQAAQLDNPKCSSCHSQSTFCGDCHRRTGVSRDGPSGNRPIGSRFHPSSQEWTNSPRGMRHHAWEAMRNMNTCTSCHSERDCSTCHASKGTMGGQGVNPHPSGFHSSCKTAFRKNSRPCLVCHDLNDPILGVCR